MGPTAVFLLTSSAMALALPAQAQHVSFDEALRQAAGASGAVQGASLDVRAKTLKRKPCRISTAPRWT